MGWGGWGAGEWDENRTDRTDRTDLGLVRENGLSAARVACGRCRRIGPGCRAFRGLVMKQAPGTPFLGARGRRVSQPANDLGILDPGTVR